MSSANRSKCATAGQSKERSTWDQEEYFVACGRKHKTWINFFRLKEISSKFLLALCMVKTVGSLSYNTLENLIHSASISRFHWIFRDDSCWQIGTESLRSRIKIAFLFTLARWQQICNQSTIAIWIIYPLK